MPGQRYSLSFNVKLNGSVHSKCLKSTNISKTKYNRVPNQHKLCFYSGRIRTLVTVGTNSSHRLTMGKMKIDNICCLIEDVNFSFDFCPNCLI